jgi:NADH-quinone oxidoreductase subunit G
VKALLVFGEDLTTEAGFTADDLAKPEFIASIQLLAGPTANASHIVLPGAAFAEKRGSMVNLSGRLQRLNRAIEPPAQARDDWEILRDLAGGTQNLIEEVFKDIASTVTEFNGLTLSKIGHQGTIITETGYEIPLLKNEGVRKAAGIING